MLQSEPLLKERPSCNYVKLPLINGDRLNIAKSLVKKAVKEKKIFSIYGCYPAIRAALRARGWVEQRQSRSSFLCSRPSKLKTETSDASDSSDDDDTGEEEERDDTEDDMRDLMSRMVRNHIVYFYWTTKKDTIDCHSLRKEQIINHYANATSFTTKVGLCTTLRNLHWFDEAHADSFFPRCYRLVAEDEKQAFIEDFRRTACTSLLLYVVERYGSESKWVETRMKGYVNFTGVRKTLKQKTHQAVGCSIIDNALLVCQEFLSSLEHSDIDITEPALSEQEWKTFLQSYYLVIHQGVAIEDCCKYVERCTCMLDQMTHVCPQLKTDGFSNIWIIKPGAKSRGRGIMCMNTLDEILSLVVEDHIPLTDTKWVVQKYIERPLLVHGTKFDVRQWFLVSDWNPLTVWFYNECYIRFSTQNFSTQNLHSSVHLCNNSIQKHYEPGPDRNPSLPVECMWSCSQFRSWLTSSGHDLQWEERVIPGMQKAVIRTLLTAQDNVEPRKGSFELYGADFMLGSDLQPWLLEINSSPTMATSTRVTARLCPAVQEDTLRVVLDRRRNRNADTGGFQLIYKQALVEVPQYFGFNLIVEGTSIKRPQVRPHCQPDSIEPELPLSAINGTSEKKNRLDEVKTVLRALNSPKVFQKSLRFKRKPPHKIALPLSFCVLPDPVGQVMPNNGFPNIVETRKAGNHLPSLYHTTLSLEVLQPKKSLTVSFPYKDNPTIPNPVLPPVQTISEESVKIYTGHPFNKNINHFSDIEGMFGQNNRFL